MADARSQCNNALVEAMNNKPDHLVFVYRCGDKITYKSVTSSPQEELFMIKLLEMDFSRRFTPVAITDKPVDKDITKI